MIPGTINQLYNIHNVYQGDTKKVLCVCSAGLLRSATLQNILIKTFGYNVRNCGTEDYALIPISEALVKWADEIVFVNEENYNKVKYQLKDFNVLHQCYVLDIPDMYEFNNPKLINICLEQYNNKKKVEI